MKGWLLAFESFPRRERHRAIVRRLRRRAIQRAALRIREKFAELAAVPEPKGPAN